MENPENTDQYDVKLFRAVYDYNTNDIIDNLKKGSSLIDLAYFIPSDDIKKYISTIDITKFSDHKQIIQSMKRIDEFYSYSEKNVYERIRTLIKKSMFGRRRPFVIFLVELFYKICKDNNLNLLLDEEYDIAKEIDVDMVSIVLHGKLDVFFHEDIDTVIYYMHFGLDYEFLSKHPLFDTIVKNIACIIGELRSIFGQTLNDKILAGIAYISIG